MFRLYAITGLLLTHLSASAQQKQTLYFENGKKAVEGKWKIVYSRRENPEYIQYLLSSEKGYEAGVTKAHEIHKDGEERGRLLQFEGPCTIFYSNGNKRVVGNYKYGIPEGAFEWYNKDGTLVTKGQFTDGMPQGKWAYYYASGKKKADAGYVAFSQKELDSMFLSRPRGIQARPASAEPNTAAADDMARYAFRSYLSQLPSNTKPDGKIVFYAEDGVKTVELNFKNGHKQGDWIRYRNTEQLLRIAYKDDTPTGLYDSAQMNLMGNSQAIAALAELVGQSDQDASSKYANGQSVVAPEVFTMVEQMPEFPGDISKYLGDHIKYPPEAIKNNIEGRVIVRFVVSKTGDVTDVTVVRGIGGGCDDEAMRLVKEMPKWKPGKQNGQAVNVFFTLPITFKLQ